MMNSRRRPQPYLFLFLILLLAGLRPWAARARESETRAMAALSLAKILLTQQGVDTTVTWYAGPGPRTACGDTFSLARIAAAAPLEGPLALPCDAQVLLCSQERCVPVTIWDRIPRRSSARYDHQILDLTPAAMAALGTPFGHTPSGLPYGRAMVTLYASETTDLAPRE